MFEKRSEKLCVRKAYKPRSLSRWIGPLLDSADDRRRDLRLSNILGIVLIREETGTHAFDLPAVKAIHHVVSGEAEVVAIRRISRSNGAGIAGGECYVSWRSSARPVVGGNPEAVMTLDAFRKEWPLLRTSFLLAQELYEATNPGTAADLGIGPTLDELLDVTREYVHTRVTYPANGDARDIGIYKWRLEARDLLENAI